MDEQYRDAWNRNIGQSETEFRAQAVRGLPAGARTELEYWGGQFNLRILKDPPEPGAWQHPFWFEYRVSPGAHMELYGADVGTRGQNISSIMNRNMLEVADRLRIPTISLYAMNVGAYQWARAGFVPHSDEWQGGLRQAIGYRLDQLLADPDTRIPKESEKALRKVLKSDDPKAIWAIADQTDMIRGQKLGQHLLVDMPWNGTCELEDPQCRARFEAHTRGEQPPKWDAGTSTSIRHEKQAMASFNRLGAKESPLRRWGLIGAAVAFAATAASLLLTDNPPATPAPSPGQPVSDTARQEIQLSAADPVRSRSAAPRAP